MSYKEWEAARRFELELQAAQIEWEHARDIAKADKKRAEKRIKAMKKARGNMFYPDPPVRYTVRVVLLVRQAHDWKGTKPVAMEFIIAGTMGETQAELQAIAKAKELGFMWVGTQSKGLVKS